MNRFHVSNLFKVGLPVSHEPKPKPKRQRGRRKPLKEESPVVVPVPVTKAPVVAKPNKKKHKQKIPVALREQVWIHRMGRVFEGKCPIPWCQNTITVFDFQSGHNIPESKGGATNLTNLVPLCSRCNQSMGDTYTIDEWSAISGEPVVTVKEVQPPKSWCCW